MEGGGGYDMGNGALSEAYINQTKYIQKEIDLFNSPEMKEYIRVVNNPIVQQEYQLLSRNKEMLEIAQTSSEQFAKMCVSAKKCLNAILPEDILGQSIQMLYSITDMLLPVLQTYYNENLITNFQNLSGVLEEYKLLHYHSKETPDEEVADNERINKKIVTEIYKSGDYHNEKIEKRETAIVTLSPINDKVLKYLSENPEELYKLGNRDFEVIMAEIYNKLGYKVELTKDTRDGGKDIIIRKPEILGDFIYYVECKKYSINNPIGVGIIRDLVGTVNTDRVNGGIIATTSYFTKDAKDLILGKNLRYQIKMHDYEVIRDLLKRIV